MAQHANSSASVPGENRCLGKSLRLRIHHLPFNKSTSPVNLVLANMRAILFASLFFLLSAALPGQNALQNAEKLSAQYAYEASSAELMQFIEAHPERKYDLGRAWALHSFNLLRLGKMEAAREANRKSFDLRRQLRSPEITENYLRAAQIDMNAKDYGAALVSAEQGMQMLIENPRVYADLNLYAAKALYKLNRKEEAQQYFDTARDVLLIEVGKADPAYADLLYQGGRIQEEREAFAEAFQLYAKAYHAATYPILQGKMLIYAWQAYWLEKWTNS